MKNSFKVFHRGAGLTAALYIAAVLFSCTLASAATVTWAGHTWTITTGGMAGSNTGSAANVTKDASGYLHLKIANISNKWYCAELFTNDSIGFGTYQWQIDGPVDKLDKNVVLGLFPYGPIANIGADGTNEIDIEYARWGNAAWPNGNWTVYPNSGKTIGETTFDFSLKSTYTTSSFVWSGTDIAYTTQEGFKAIGDTGGLVKKWTYAPANPAVNIPQRAMPLGMNLWLCSGCGGAPSDGQGVDIIIRKFTYLAPGATPSIAKANAGAGTKSAMILHRTGKGWQLDCPAPHEFALHILDTRGRLVSDVRIPAGARELPLEGIGAGVHIVKAHEGDIAPQRIVVP